MQKNISMKNILKETKFLAFNFYKTISFNSCRLLPVCSGSVYNILCLVSSLLDNGAERHQRATGLTSQSAALIFLNRLVTMIRSPLIGYSIWLLLHVSRVRIWVSVLANKVRTTDRL